MRTRSKLETIASVIEGLFKKKGLTKKFRQHQVWDIWEEIVGPAVAKEAAPSRVQGDTLVVGVKSPAWMQELVFLKPRILAKIRENLPEAGIKNVRFETAQSMP